MWCGRRAWKKLQNIQSNILSPRMVVINFPFFQVLLDLARTIFEEQSTLHNIVQKIMMITQTLLQCERCSVLLVDPTSKVFSGQSCLFGVNLIIIRVFLARQDDWVGKKCTWYKVRRSFYEFRYCQKKFAASAKIDSISLIHEDNNKWGGSYCRSLFKKVLLQ